MSRVKNASRNIIYGYLGTFLTLAVKFVSRTIFIHTIGITYLGVNGLYTNILSLLSFAELGIGTAMNYSLYKPVSNNDREKIRSLMYLYKRAYRWIAIVVTGIGIVLIPFLKNIVKDPGVISSNELIIYYVIFLFNTVSTYFVSYKYSLANAEQKNYIETNIRTISTLTISVVQILILMLYRNFLFFLSIAAVVELILKLFVNQYFNRVYPFLLDDKVQPLSCEETLSIKKNIKALVYHKIGDISALQTDNILISAFINVATVGIISNFVLIIASITSFIDIIFNSLISGFGNLIATESKDKQFKLFKVYRFVGFWCYGFASIAFVILLVPFIELWIGSKMLVENLVVYLMIMDYYFKGHRIIVNNFKLAAGVFQEDKYLSFIRGIVNLIISIILVKTIGLPGIYIGTVVSGLILNLVRPRIIYNKVFGLSVKDYYMDSLIYLTVIIIPLSILLFIKNLLVIQTGYIYFSVMVLLVVIITNLIFSILFRNREEYIYILNLIKMKLGRKNAL